VATTLLILFAIWAVTFPAVLGLARLLGRLSGPRDMRAVAEASDEGRQPDNVVALVPRPQNELVAPRRAA
jgi:hypothetical protein